MSIVAQKIDKNMYQIKGFEAERLGKERIVQIVRRDNKENPMIRIMDSAIKNFGWGYGDTYRVYITEKKILLEKE